MMQQLQLEKSLGKDVEDSVDSAVNWANKYEHEKNGCNYKKKHPKTNRWDFLG